MSTKPGTLYVVATPIGNLDDMTHRAEGVLRQVDRICCEDTRHSGKLLEHLGIKARLVSLHDHNERDRVAQLLDWLAAGERIALISDAGTPLISDPGYIVVREARAAGHAVVPIPGASAVVTALSAAGLPTDRFRFEGFLSAKANARREQLKSLSREPATLVFYESPHRVAALVEDIAAVLGQERRVVIARELTKRFEEFIEGEAASLASRLAEGIRGECVVMVAGAEVDNAPDIDADTLLRALLQELPASKAAKLAAKITGQPRNALYDRATELAKS
ncbi:MAG: 16S rRNA (cytidine(1402)-2'-O)-methyltransferase [Gammaproteobacteria bacterium]|nr:16S rRNA (cytidine(1402)-2'-O)-methyltransferase [Gammaproteobacteria bacterium]